MTLNDPIVLYILGAAGAVAAWFARREDRRIGELEAAVALLKVQMASHDTNKQLLDRMYTELQELKNLTNRIAGHLKIG